MQIVKFLMAIAAWAVKNAALLIGIVEAVAKMLAGIISLTPTKSDDKIIPMVDKVASAMKKALYFISDKLAGKEATVPN